MRVWFLAVLVILAVVAAIFAVSNPAAVVLSFWPLPYEINTWIWLVVFATLIAGFLLGWTYGWFRHRRIRRAARSYKKRIMALEAEIAALRAAGAANAPTVNANTGKALVA